MHSAMQNGQGAAESFSTRQESNQSSQTHILPLATKFFAVVRPLFKLNIKARHEIPEFLNANL